MTRFVTYDPEVAARLAQAVGMHRVELRDTSRSQKTLNPALVDAIRSPQRAAVFMASSDEQLLQIRFNREDSSDGAPRTPRKRKPGSQENTELGSRPSGFLGLEDEAYSKEQEDPPRSLWKQDE